MATDIPVRALRTEATSSRVDQLTEDQQRAFKVLVALVEGAVASLPSHEEWHRSDDEIEFRAVTPADEVVSRVLLLSGGRGSGKTTLADTLANALHDPYSLYKARGADLKQDEARGLYGRVDKLRDRIIVLEKLMLADAPIETNFLAALLARIEQHLFPHLSQETVAMTGGEQLRHKAVLDLLRLQTDVALACNGNLSDRRGQIDPDNFAMEEMRVERVRLQLRERFERVLRKTARDSLGRSDPALFLLVVDDVDTNPGVIVELVERIRLVSVRELLVLLVGDRDTIQSAFQQSLADRFRAAAETRLKPIEFGMDPREMATMTNALALSALRKHIPYHQRVQLQPLSAVDTLGIHPLGTTVPALRSNGESELDRPTEQTVGKRLQVVKVTCSDDTHRKVCKVDPDTGYKVCKVDLEAFINPRVDSRHHDEEKLSHDHDEEKRPHDAERECPRPRSWYSGSWALADSPRVAVDLWNTLFEAQDSGSSFCDPWADEGAEPDPDGLGVDPRLQQHFRQLAAERLSSRPGLWGGVEPTPGSPGAEVSPISPGLRDLIIHRGNLSPVGLRAHHQVDFSPVPRCFDDLGPDVEAHRAQRVFWAPDTHVHYSIRGGLATAREVGPLVLAEDLFALQYRSAQINSTVVRCRDDLCWVVSQTEVQTTAEESAAPRLMPGPGVTMADQPESWRPLRRYGTPWLIPLFATMRQVENLAFVWRKVVGQQPSTPGSGPSGMAGSGNVHGTTATRLARMWIQVNTELLFRRPPSEYGEVLDVTPQVDVSGASPDGRDPNCDWLTVRLADEGRRRGEPAGETPGPAPSASPPDTLERLEELLLRVQGRTSDAKKPSPDAWQQHVAADWLGTVSWLVETIPGLEWFRLNGEEGRLPADEQQTSVIEPYRLRLERWTTSLEPDRPAESGVERDAELDGQG